VKENAKLEVIDVQVLSLLRREREILSVLQWQLDGL